MNRAERLSAVLDLLAESGQVEVDQIVDRLDVSPATARRDLDALAEQQLLTRTRGGAVAHSVAYDLPIRYKNQQNPEAKAAIARAASALVPRGAVIGLCGGTTATAIADALMSRADIMEPSPEPSLTVVTNAINIAMQLAMRPADQDGRHGRGRARALVRARRRLYRRGARQHHPRPRLHRRQRRRRDRRPDVARRARGGRERAHGIARRQRSARRRLRRRSTSARSPRSGTAGCSPRSSPMPRRRPSSASASPTAASTLSLPSEHPRDRHPLRPPRERPRHRCRRVGALRRRPRRRARNRRRLARRPARERLGDGCRGPHPRARLHRPALPRRRRRVRRGGRRRDRDPARRAHRARHHPLGALARDRARRSALRPARGDLRASPPRTPACSGPTSRVRSSTTSSAARTTRWSCAPPTPPPWSACSRHPTGCCGRSPSHPSTPARPRRSRRFADAGVAVAVGHTGADFETTLAAFGAGAIDPDACVQRHARHPPSCARPGGRGHARRPRHPRGHQRRRARAPRRGAARLRRRPRPRRARDRCHGGRRRRRRLLPARLAPGRRAGRRRAAARGRLDRGFDPHAGCRAAPRGRRHAASPSTRRSVPSRSRRRPRSAARATSDGSTPATPRTRCCSRPSSRSRPCGAPERGSPDRRRTARRSDR